MKVIVKILKLIPIKSLVKYLPDVLAYVFTRVLTFMLKKYPHKSDKVMETASDLAKAMAHAVEAAEDGVITKFELSKQQSLWREVFK